MTVNTFYIIDQWVGSSWSENNIANIFDTKISKRPLWDFLRVLWSRGQKWYVNTLYQRVLDSMMVWTLIHSPFGCVLASYAQGLMYRAVWLAYTIPVQLYPMPPPSLDPAELGIFSCNVTSCSAATSPLHKMCSLVCNASQGRCSRGCLWIQERK